MANQDKAAKLAKPIMRLLPIIVATLVLLLPQYATCATKEQLPNTDLALTILHTNDLHAHDESFSEAGKTIGGLPRIGALIKQQKATNPNCLVIDAGDIFQGTPFYEFYNGAVEIHMLVMADYDIYTIGNHEFDNGPWNLAKQLARARFDVISANLDADAVPDLKSKFKPSTVKTIDGKKIGFVGGITPDLEQTELTLGGVKIKKGGPDHKDWIQPIKEEVERLANDGITRIILVTHIGVEGDKKLAEHIPQVDAIIGGHSHTRLAEPVIVTRPDGTTCTIVQTGCYGRNLGKLQLAFDEHGNVISPKTNYQLIPVTDKVKEEPEMKAYLQKQGGPVRELQQKVVGYAEGNFPHTWSRYLGDSPLGDLICDAIYEEGTKFGATISMHNRGGIRTGIEKGPITRAKVSEVLPFENHLVVATISGETLLNALEHSFSGHLGDRFLDVHGLKITYDPSKPAGSKVVSVEAQDDKGVYQKLDPNGKYRIAINDYSFGGGEGFDFSKAEDVHKSKDKQAIVFAAYLEKFKKVTPQAGGRITAITTPALSNSIDHLSD